MSTPGESKKENVVVIAAKSERIRAAHVAPLNALVDTWRSQAPELLVPRFDPDDGGVNARVLILMESPAPSTVRAGGTGFCSEDNPDRSNELLSRLRAAAGVPRSACLKWNVVPWAVLDTAGHPTSPSAGDLRAAAACLDELLEVASRIEVVITLGRPAMLGFMNHTSSKRQPLRRVVAAPHPSQRNAGARAESIARIENAFASVAAFLEGSADP